MNKRTRFFLLPAGSLFLLLASCETAPPPAAETTASFGPGFPAGSAAWRERERAAYQAAFEAGRRDQREGYKYDDDRVSVPLSQDLRSFARQGYRAGYTRGQEARRAARAARRRAEAEAPAAGTVTPGGAAAVPGTGTQAKPGTAAPPVPEKPKVTDPFAIPLDGAGAGAGTGLGEEIR